MSWMEVRFGSGGNGEVDLTVLRSENKQRKRTNWRFFCGGGKQRKKWEEDLDGTWDGTARDKICAPTYTDFSIKRRISHFSINHTV